VIAMGNSTRPIAEIMIGDRHRHDMGDIEGLAASISDIGLLHPIVIRGDGLLLAGRRRLEACRLLGWDALPVSVAKTGDERG
jgi:ParB family transcriptional regulator, chromosome partitioning protein